ncbi:MAG: DUF4442 domain-containing protein [Planctomycetes bacterium]|nr:DUF4442 domain-containing protein [Planctomycetota bacterium]
MSSAPAESRITKVESTTVARTAPIEPAVAKKTLSERAEAFISRLSTRNWFWQKVCSLIWLPYAFRSGITMRRVDSNRFTALLPFSRGNRNWYNAMAGAALLGNSEVAAGLFLFGKVGSDYFVVCKKMEYRFLRPCVGPALYDIAAEQDIDELVKAGGEFNIDLDINIHQQMGKKRGDKRVGRCRIIFHCTPKAAAKARALRKSKKLSEADAAADN